MDEKRKAQYVANLARGPLGFYDLMMAYEASELESEEQYLELFQGLIDTGLAWQLQGSIYGRPAADLIQKGLCRPAGQ